MTLAPGYHAITLTKSTDAEQLDANEDYTGGAVRFVLEPAAGEIYELVDLAAAIHDDDSDYNKYGNLSALSPTGIRIVVEDADDNTELRDLTAGRTITKTEDWFLINWGVEPLGSSAGATRGTRAFKTYPAEGVVINGNHNHRLAVLVPAEDFSTLEFHAFVAGVRVRHRNT